MFSVPVMWMQLSASWQEKVHKGMLVEQSAHRLIYLAIFDSKHKSRRDVHKKLTDDCVAILTAYRTNCAATTSAGQLILPEAFKLLPIYAHGLMRSQALRGGTKRDVQMTF